MVIINDHVAAASGAVHYGVNGGISEGAFEINSLSPFGHVHHLSGIVHDPLLGQSGVYRFSLANQCFELSYDGGLTFQCARFVQNAAPASGLHFEYLADNHINARTIVGNIELIANTAKIRFSSVGDLPPVNLSGVLETNFSSTNTHDLWMVDQSQVSGHMFVANYDDIRAKSLGIGTLALDVGSGITNIRVGSGIAHFATNTAQTISNVSPPTDIALQWGTTIVSDRNYLVQTATSTIGRALFGGNTANGEIVVMSAGLYRVNVHMSATITVGTDTSILATEVRKLPHNAVSSTAGTNLRNSAIAYSYHRTSSVGLGSSDMEIVFNAEAGDRIYTIVRKQAGTVGTTLATVSGESTFSIYRIGDKRL